MTSSPSSVFLTGATGYVGGDYLQVLLSLPNPPKQVSALVRSADKGKLLASLSTHKTTIEPIIGTLQDHDLLTKLAAEHDLTLETADSDDLPMVQAIIAGLKKRTENGKEAVFIHVSGTGTLSEYDDGMCEGKLVRRP
jgi:uncharacterized protein YbjT (DUF2867 family)